jgi:multisubunit Na+/H+ antiporter MnhE subunit
MLQASALFLGVFALWMVLQRELSAPMLAAGAIAALACVLITAALPRLGRDLFTRMPRFIAVETLRVGAAFADAATTVRAALAGDVKLRPALVRVRTRASDVFSIFVLAHWISGTPGAVVIAADDEGLLVHVNDENDERFENIGSWEETLLAGRRRGPAQ